MAAGTLGPNQNLTGTPGPRHAPARGHAVRPAAKVHKPLEVVRCQVEAGGGIYRDAGARRPSHAGLGYPTVEVDGLAVAIDRSVLRRLAPRAGSPEPRT